jgi:hypothetical protein
MFRIRQPGAAMLAPHMRKRLLVVCMNDFLFLLVHGSARFDELSADVRRCPPAGASACSAHTGRRRRGLATARLFV